MVQKGLNSTLFQNQSKVDALNLNSLVDPQISCPTEKLVEFKEAKNTHELSMQLCPTISEPNIEKNDLIQEAMQMNSVPAIPVYIPIQNIKLEFQQGFEQFTQILVSDSSENEPLICQPLVFDNLQPLPHFVQLNSRSMCNQNQSQFLQ